MGERNKQINILTVDVEDWPQSTLDHTLPITSRVVTNTKRLLELFAYYNVKATFFILGLVAKKYPSLVKEIAKMGHEIATHGYSHRPIFTLTPSEFAADIDKSLAIIEGVIGYKVLGYRAPDFSITKKSLWALEILRERGFLYDSSIFPIFHFRYGIPTFPRFPYRMNNGVYEIPPSTIRIGWVNIPVGGGGYLRLFPYWFTRWSLRLINSEGFPAIVYLHPYELDVLEFKKIKCKTPFSLRISQSINRKTVGRKIRLLFEEFSFVSIKEGVPFD